MRSEDYSLFAANNGLSMRTILIIHSVNMSAYFPELSDEDIASIVYLFFNILIYYFCL
jgi:hypothetical protein